MIPIQIHLAIVHVPVLGMVFATLIFIFSSFRQRVEWKRMAYMIYILSALGALIAFFSGHGSEDMAQQVLDLSREKIHEHEEGANFALAYALAAGLLSFTLLFFDNKLSSAWRRNLGRVLMLVGILGSVAFGVTAHHGGSIRHPEISPDSPSTLIPPASTSGKDSGKADD